MEDEVNVEPVFRTAKRRKPFRRRASSGSEDGLLDAAQTGVSGPSTSNVQGRSDQDGESEGEGRESRYFPQSPSKATRRPRGFRPHRGGIAFTTRDATHSTHTLDGENGALVPVDENGNAVEAAMNRFAPQTGQVIDPNDHHMMAYVDAEIARLRGGTNPQSQSRDEPHSPSAPAASSHGTSRKPADSATHGKLQEVDLGPDAAARNVARTQAATRRLLGDADTATEEDSREGSPAKGRVGRDGKPLRRKRQRRTSDEIRRDDLVESILRENRLELYDDTLAPRGSEGNEVEASDERIAEQFKQEFMDAVQTRNRELANRKPTASGTVGRGAAQNTEARGPKLGGSRNARAAMRAKEAAAQQRAPGR